MLFTQLKENLFEGDMMLTKQNMLFYIFVPAISEQLLFSYAYPKSLEMRRPGLGRIVLLRNILEIYGHFSSHKA